MSLFAYNGEFYLLLFAFGALLISCYDYAFDKQIVPRNRFVQNFLLVLVIYTLFINVLLGLYSVVFNFYCLYIVFDCFIYPVQSKKAEKEVYA